MAENGARRSARANIGVPPSRYREHVDAPAATAAAADNKSVKTLASSYKTSASRRKVVDLEADKKLLDIQAKIMEKESELQKAEIAARSIQKKLDAYKNGSQQGDAINKIISELIQSQIEAEDKIEALKVDFNAMKKLSEGQVQIVQQEREVEHDKVDIEEDEGASSVSSAEDKNKEERMKNWLEEQNHNVPPVQMTPLTRTCVDATKAVIVKTPEDNGAGAYQEPTSYARRGNMDFPPQIKQAVYVHKKQKPLPTQSYGESSDEDFDFHPRAISSPKKHDGQQVTMKDLVTALSQFGANTSQPQVVMKTTMDKDLPKFGGEPGDWIQFKSEYDRTTSEYRISDSENMIRLRRALIGQAKTTVQHLMINVNNVSIIMDSLEKRFGRPRVVLNALANKAKMCANVTLAKPETIIEFGIAVQALVSNVVSYKEDGYLNSVELMETLVKKLSPDLATWWFQWLAADKTRNENLLGFSEWSSLQLDIAYQRVDFKPKELDDKAERRHKRGPGAINAITVESELCSCCGKQNHKLEKCWSFQKKNLDDRWKIVKRDRYCICCLQLGHRARDCEFNRDCGINKCTKVHHGLLHYDKKNEEEARQHDKMRDRDNVRQHDKHPDDFGKARDGRVQFDGNIAVITGCDGPLPIVPVQIIGPKGTAKCFALLDTAASRSLIKKDLAEKIGLEGDEFEYKYGGITGGTTEKEAQRVNCQIAGVYRGSQVKKLRSAVTVQDIKLNSYSIDMTEIKRKWPFLNCVPACNLINVVPEIIVGNNNPHLILARKIVKRGDHEPIGWRCELGWAVSGDFANDGTGSICSLYGNQWVSNDELNTHEDFGLKVPMLKGKNLDEKRVNEILDHATKMTGGRLETGPLWREDDVVFPESGKAAVGKWIPTNMNIANVAKRFEMEISFDPYCEWFQGPQFLLSSSSEWNFEEDRKRAKAEGVIAAVAGKEANVVLVDLKCITPDPGRFSSYWRLVRSTAAVRKAAQYWLSKVRKVTTDAPWKLSSEKVNSQISAEELMGAEILLIKLAQSEHFSEDIELLKKGSLKKGKLWRLSPKIDDEGILHVDGRIERAPEVDDDVKCPIVLPHRVTELLVDLEHVKNDHQGVETVLSNLRQRVWIIDARHTVKSAWIRYQSCHFRKCKPATPRMSELPPARLASRQPPFTYTGIDLFGPLEVTVGRRHEKRWGVLICCMVTRAVHLEVVHSLYTDEIIMAFSLFIDTRGRPAMIHSDNGTNFVGAAKELKEQWKLVDAERIQACGGLKWSFNPPAALIMGGVWKRLIQTVKKCLMVTLREKYPKDTTLLNVLKAAENMMSSRPLTLASTGPSDPELITPNRILRGGFDAGPAIPSVLDPEDEFLRLQWKRGQVLADQFWERWTRFYLPKLIRREKWQDAMVLPLEKGALVFIVDNQLPRNCWVRGYVSKVFPGNGNQVRTVEVMTRDPVTLRMKAVTRPVVKLCPLGLKMEIRDPNEP